MMHVNAVRIAVLLGLVLSAVDAQDSKQKETDTRFENLAELVAFVKKADKVVLYEGLPHQAFERELLNEELKAGKSVELHGYPFYKECLDLKEEDGKKLAALYLDGGTFEKFSGHKWCGGYHPDYCIEWRIGKETVRALICYGCHEMKSYGPKVELHSDIANKALEEFKTILKPYRKNRPEKK